ncbi:MAG: hypothetical protein OEM63_10945 [Gammaproteobacteria bacterium]|nr:hypothetical protein [Gammaproteobacteria bacterium]
MKRPSFFHGVLVAAALAFGASAIIAALTPFVGIGSVIRLCIPLVALAYVLYLLRSSSERIGAITTLSIWSALAIGAWWISPPLPLYVLIHAGAVWLVRSLYFYSGVVPALLDMGLTALSIAGFVWAASRTGSVFMATWCLFLVQALFTVIPQSIQKKNSAQPDVGNEPFERARRQADEALRLLAN